MTKQEFLKRLRRGISGLPGGEKEGYLTFYREMLEDRMEDGISEEAAVREIGDVEEIIAQIAAETASAGPVRENKRKGQGWKTVCVVLGAPLWLPLLLAALAILISVYAVLWSVVISLWAAEVSLWAGVISGTAVGMVLALKGSLFSGGAWIGAGLACAGIAIFLFVGCKAATKGTWLLAKRSAMAIRKGAAKGERA